MEDNMDIQIQKRPNRMNLWWLEAENFASKNLTGW